jgi:putative NIF3 family GTP cyclohydrolase 1 type 2
MTDVARLSRREFGALAAGAPLAFGLRLSIAPVAAGEMFERIKAAAGVVVKADSVDGLKAGDAATPVIGIVTTAMATLDVLRQAVKAGANVVITHEPAFYASNDARQPPPARGGFQATPPEGQDARPDPVYAAKNAFIDQHRLVIVRLRDHWRLRQPSPMAEGLGGALGWRNHQAGADPSRYEIPAVALGALAASVKTRLAGRGGLRVIGDPNTSIRRVALLPGSTPIAAALAALPAADAVIAGEVREWESVEYARDAIYARPPKGLILTGRILSEEPGMRACATWLKTIVDGVPVSHIAAGDPYWRPR